MISGPSPPVAFRSGCPQNGVPMDRFQRILLLHRILAGRRVPVSHRTIEEKLECRRATVTRIIQEMREFLDAPIEYD